MLEFCKLIGVQYNLSCSSLFNRSSSSGTSLGRARLPRPLPTRRRTRRRTRARSPARSRGRSRGRSRPTSRAATPARSRCRAQHPSRARHSRAGSGARRHPGCALLSSLFLSLFLSSLDWLECDSSFLFSFFCLCFSSPSLFCFSFPFSTMFLFFCGCCSCSLHHLAGLSKHPSLLPHFKPFHLARTLVLE